MELKITYYKNNEEVSNWAKAEYAEIEPATECRNIYEAMLFGFAAAEYIKKMRKVADVQHLDGDYYMTVFKAR